MSQAARLLVNELIADINAGESDLMDVERRIVKFTNTLGGLVTQEVIELDFPNAVAILDVYHALEHLAAFCNLHPNSSSAAQYYRRLHLLMVEGDTLQMLHEMKSLRTMLSDPDEGQKHINYFMHNIERMAYDHYRARGYPIDSGVEGRCKLVVGKRFKGNGMRWKKLDNAAVLNARLHFLNGTLERHFSAPSNHRKAA